MNCPKCNGTFQEKKYGGQITIKRCDDCGGILTGSQTLLKMRDEWMADIVLDKGDHKVGKKMDRIDDINCPQCSAVMNKTFDEEQSHIWFESCQPCDLIMLDAGELTDLKHLTLMDKVRDLFPR